MGTRSLQRCSGQALKASSTAILELVRPNPGRRLGLVDAVLVRVIAAFDLLVQKALLGVATDLLQAWHAVYQLHMAGRPHLTTSPYTERQRGAHSTPGLPG